MTSPHNATDRKILVIRGGAAGDFILTLPVLAALRLRFPQHRLEILGYPSIAALAVAAGLADDASALESPRFTGLFVPNGSWPAEVSAWFSGFELIISYLHDPGDIFRSNAARCSSALFIAGPHRPDETLAVHAAELLLRPLQAVGIRGADPRPRLPLPATRPSSTCRSRFDNTASLSWISESSALRWAWSASWLSVDLSAASN